MGKKRSVGFLLALNLSVGLVINLSGGSFVRAEEWMTLKHVFEGEHGLDFLGWALASPGDLDGDGQPDIMVGMPLAAKNPAVNVGRVFIYSGQSGGLLFSLEGSGAKHELGFSLSAVGDIDGDGVPDFLLGAPGASPAHLPHAGSVYLYSGKTHAVLKRLDGREIKDAFGLAVSGGADFNEDGVPDIAIGSPYSDPLQSDPSYRRGTPSANSVGLSAAGSVYVFSGSDGGLLLRLNGMEPHGHFGRTLEVMGDVTGDGIPDIAVSAPTASPNRLKKAGRVFIYSGKDGALLRFFDGPEADAHFGLAVARVQDLDGDGIPDLAVGAPGLSPQGLSGAGSVLTYSGRDGKVLYRWDGLEPGEQFGRTVLSLGDLDRDGVDDLVIGSPGASSGLGPDTGRISSYSGKEGKLLFRLNGRERNGKFGHALAKTEDMNQDGIPDLLVGAPNASSGTKMAAGRAYLFLTNLPVEE